MPASTTDQAFDARLRIQEQWASGHEQRCEGRHLAIGRRFDEIDENMRAVKQDLAVSSRETKEALALATAKSNRLLAIAVLFLSLLVFGAKTKYAEIALAALGLL